MQEFNKILLNIFFFFFFFSKFFYSFQMQRGGGMSVDECCGQFGRKIIRIKMKENPYVLTFQFIYGKFGRGIYFSAQLN